MESALKMPEIIRAIIQAADSNTQTRTARVSKQWNDAALSMIWLDLDSIVPLLKLLAPIRRVPYPSMFEFEHLPSDEGWERLKRIAPRVRSLTHHDEQTIEGRDNSHLSSFVFVDLVAMHSRPLLPNLRELEWHVLRLDTPFSLLFLFLGPRLRRLSLEIDISEIPATSFNHLFRHLTKWTPLLTHFNLYSNVPAREVQNDLAFMINGLTSLQVIGLPPYHHTSTVVDALATAPALQEVRTGWLAGPTNPDEAHTDFKDGWFRNLERIDLEVPPPRAIQLIQSDYRPLNLTRLRLTCTLNGDTDQLERFLSAVGTALPGLTLMSLNLWGSHTPIPAPLLFDTLRPLLACRHITYFELGHNQPLQLEESHIEELAEAWPDLTDLMICEDPVYQAEGARGVPLNLLSLIAQRFPALQVLALFLDGKAPRPEESPRKFQHLHELNVGTSKLELKNAMPVALYIADLCRLPVNIIKGKSAWHVAGVWDLEEDDTVYLSSNTAWAEVGKAAKAIHSHQEEKEKSKRQPTPPPAPLNDAERELLQKFRDKSSDLEAKVRQLEAALAHTRLSPAQPP